MDTDNTQQRRALPRCRVCRLPADTLAEVERERLAWGATFEQLAEKVRASGHATSASSLRRHFRSHASDLAHHDTNEPLADLKGITTPFDGLLDGKIRERDVTEAVVKVLVQRMQRLETEQQAVRDHSRADRLWTRSLKTMAMLERTLKRLEEIRQPERDVKAMVADSLQRALAAIIETYNAGAKEQIAMVKQGAYDFLDQKLRPEDFLRLISRWERECSTGMASRIAEAAILSFREAGAPA